MSVALDAVGAGVTFTGVTSASWSHTRGAGSDFFLDISVGYAQAGSGNAAATATYDGVSWTALADESIAGGGEEEWAAAFGAINPPSGTKIATLAWAQAAYGHANSRSWLNVDQATPVGTITGYNADANPISVGPVSTPSGGALFDVASFEQTTTFTGSHTEDSKAAGFSGQYYWGALQHTFSAGSQTLTWTADAANRGAQVVVPLNAAAGGGVAEGAGALIGTGELLGVGTVVAATQAGAGALTGVGELLGAGAAAQGSGGYLDGMGELQGVSAALRIEQGSGYLAGVGELYGVAPGGATNEIITLGARYRRQSRDRLIREDEDDIAEIVAMAMQTIHKLH